MPRKDPAAIRITSATAPRSQDIAARQRRYLISMGIRTVCFVAAVLVEGWLRWALVTAAIFLPYLAVVMANTASGPDTAGPPPFDPERRAIEPPRE